MDKGLFGYISLLFTIAAYAPYVWSCLKGRTKPHIFSWLLWSILMLIATFGQKAGFAGPGAWATFFSGLSCFIITLVALKSGDKNINRKDIFVLVIALAAIPLWYITQHPLSAIALITFIDALSYLPTIRKSIARPYEEMPVHYIISNCKHSFSIMAMSVYSLTTVLYPAVLFFMNALLVGIIYWRRYQHKKTPPPKRPLFSRYSFKKPSGRVFDHEARDQGLHIPREAERVDPSYSARLRATRP